MVRPWRAIFILQTFLLSLANRNLSEGKIPDLAAENEGLEF